MYMLANLAVGAAGSWPGATDPGTRLPANLLIADIRAYASSNTVSVTSDWSPLPAPALGAIAATLAASGTAPPSPPPPPAIRTRCWPKP